MASVTVANIKELQAKLLEWFKLGGRSFPWRANNLGTYELVIAEVLLQRTRAETVAAFYPSFITRFPSWAAVVAAPLAEIEDFLRPVGLYRQRAKRLQNLAIEMVNREGVFPSDRQELESIPFLGQYIANAVELLVFKSPSPLLDVNMARVLERYFGERKLADIRYDPYLQALAKQFVNHSRSKSLNWATLDFAALVCKARNPLCSSCLLKNECNYYSKLVNW